MSKNVGYLIGSIIGFIAGVTSGIILKLISPETTSIAVIAITMLVTGFSCYTIWEIIPATSVRKRRKRFEKFYEELLKGFENERKIEHR